MGAKRLMRFLSIIINDKIVAQIPALEITDDQAILLDTMLRMNGLVKENEEIAITQEF